MHVHGLDPLAEMQGAGLESIRHQLQYYHQRMLSRGSKCMGLD